jgi:hypothetical protein
MKPRDVLVKKKQEKEGEISKSLVLHAKLKPYRPFGIQYAHTCMRPSFLTDKIELYHNAFCLGIVSSLQLRQLFGVHSVAIRDKNCFLKKRERFLW